MIGKKEMIAQIVERYNNEHEDEGTKLTKTAASEMFDVVFDSLVEMLESGVEVGIPTLGRFKIVERGARTAHNPRTMEEVEVPEHKVLKFTPAKNIKDAIF